jgi:hypothetical protein
MDEHCKPIKDVRFSLGTIVGHAMVDTSDPIDHPIKWNPWNKVVQDHRDGMILPLATELARRKRGLPVPWTREIGAAECRQPAVW